MEPAKRKAPLKNNLPARVDLPERFTSEPLYLLLKKFSPLLIFAILFEIGLADDLLFGLMTGNWNSRSNVIGVFDIRNLPPLIMSLIIEPGVWALFVSFPPELSKLFTNIENRGIFVSGQENYRDRLYYRLKSMMSAPLFSLSVAFVAIVLALYAIWVGSEASPPHWFYLGWHFWVCYVRYCAFSYVAIWVINWNLITLITLYGLFSTSKIKVNPYDSDNAGGLHFVGKYILNVSRLALIISPYLAVEFLPEVRMTRDFLGEFNLWLGLIIIPTLLAIMIYLPLTACRQAMLAAKEEFLNPIRDKILVFIKRARARKRISKPQLEELTALIDFQAKLRKDFPTWPIDTSMFREIGTTFVLSLLPPIFTVIQISQAISKTPAK